MTSTIAFPTTTARKTRAKPLAPSRDNDANSNTGTYYTPKTRSPRPSTARKRAARDPADMWTGLFLSPEQGQRGAARRSMTRRTLRRKKSILHLREIFKNGGNPTNTGM